MIYALVDGAKSEAWPGGEATCPTCQALLVAKCGDINAWHWAHRTTADCDPWHEGESDWHLSWKRLVRPEFCEVRMGPHRADIVGHAGLVVELQHSNISPAEISERESFYRRMIWLFDAEPFIDNVWFRLRDGYYSFRWKHARKTHAECQAPVYWDCGERGIFQIKKVYAKSPVGGWGVWHRRELFLARVFGNRLSDSCAAEIAEWEASR